MTVADWRVSRQAQKPALPDPLRALEPFRIAQGLPVDEWLHEIGGGLNFKRPKFAALAGRTLQGEIATRAMAHPDRLARFGYNGRVHLCQIQRCQPNLGQGRGKFVAARPSFGR